MNKILFIVCLLMAGFAFADEEIDNEPVQQKTDAKNEVYELEKNYDKYEDITWAKCSKDTPIETRGTDYPYTAVSMHDYIGVFPSGLKTLRLYFSSMACDKYYDSVDKILLINDESDRFSMDIPYSDCKFSYSQVSFDVLLCSSNTSFSRELLKKVLMGTNVELAVTMSESGRHIHKINKDKAQELLFVIDSYEKLFDE